MPLSLTCACGALLEIDDKFIGQRIPCPDCNRLLDTTPAAPEPTATSGLAMTSFLLATAGAFTFIGPLLAVVLGVLALRRIRAAAEPVGGKRFAQAGVSLGCAFTLLTFAVLYSSELVRVHGWLRAIEWAGRIDYSLDDPISINASDGFAAGDSATIQRPSPAWGQSTYRKSDTRREDSDDLVLVNPWEDAFIVCLTKEGAGQTPDECKQDGQQRFLQSELIRGILGRMTADSPPLSFKERDAKKLANPDMQEFILDLRLGGIDRTFLVRVVRDARGRLGIVAAGTFASRFARLQPVFAKAVESYKLDK